MKGSRFEARRCTYYQMHWRKGISLLVHQKPVIKVSPLQHKVSWRSGHAAIQPNTYGVTAASKSPMITTNRSVLNPQVAGIKIEDLHRTATGKLSARPRTNTLFPRDGVTYRRRRRCSTGS